MRETTQAALLHVAIDLGASGGRVALGAVTNGKLGVEVLHRFGNAPVGLPTPHGPRLYWDVLGLWREILQGLRLAAERAHDLGAHISSVGVDSWAIDYALLDGYGLMLDGVHCYRDARTDGVMDDAFRVLPPGEIYGHTGIQFLGFNTLYQLLAIKRDAPGLLERASTFLMVPDLLHYWLSGVVGCERSNASTTQLYDPSSREWSEFVCEAFGVPSELLPALVEPGTVLGPLRDELALELGLTGCVVIAPASHDTASAVAAVPFAVNEQHAAYISSGTWSLVGLETQQPVLSGEALDTNLTNEAGVDGTNRLLKNVMGLWILQQCREAWGLEWDAIYAQAELAPPLSSLIDPDDSRFLSPGADMPDRVYSYCLESNQATPISIGQIARCVLESLALKYRVVLEKLEKVMALNDAGRIRRIHIVGGGSQVKLLNQMTANATGCEVITGPVDATLTGNLLVQAEAMGTLKPGQRREVVRASVELRRFSPKDGLAWDAAFERFKAL